METSTIRAGTVSDIYRQIAINSQTIKPEKNLTPDKSATGESIPATDSVQFRNTVTSQNLDTVRTIEQMHAQLNQLAKGVRQSNEAINKVADQVVQLKDNLIGPGKIFPPYPADSKQRANQMNEFASLRKQLLGLEVPPPPAPVYEKVKAMWQDLFDSNGKIIQTTVPELDNKSSDTQLKDAKATLDTTVSKLSDLSNKVTQAFVKP